MKKVKWHLYYSDYCETLSLFEYYYPNGMIIGGSKYFYVGEL